MNKMIPHMAAMVVYGFVTWRASRVAFTDPAVDLAVLTAIGVSCATAQVFALEEVYTDG